MSSPFDQAGMLMRSLVSNVSDQQRQRLASASCSPLIQHSSRWRCIDGCEHGKETLATRTGPYRMRPKAPLDSSSCIGLNKRRPRVQRQRGQRGIELLDVWAYLSGRDSTDGTSRRLWRTPELVVELLRAAAGKATRMESGRTFRADLQRDGYDRVARIVYPAAVWKSCRPSTARTASVTVRNCQNSPRTISVWLGSSPKFTPSSCEMSLLPLPSRPRTNRHPEGLADGSPVR